MEKTMPNNSAPDILAYALTGASAIMPMVISNWIVVLPIILACVYWSLMIHWNVVKPNYGSWANFFKRKPKK